MLHLRNYLFVIFLLTGATASMSQSKKFACYYDGYWGNWSSYSAQMQGNYSGFNLYLPWEHPSNYFFSIDIDNRTPPTKKEVKQHFKNKTWWEYTGTVEYYVCDVYPTIKDCLKEFGRPLMKSDLETTEYSSKLSVLRATRIRQQGSFVAQGYTKRSARATIKIEPYSYKTLKPMVYNIFFDGIGLGLDLDGSYFPSKF